MSFSIKQLSHTFYQIIYVKKCKAENITHSHNQIKGKISKYISILQHQEQSLYFGIILPPTSRLLFPSFGCSFNLDPIIGNWFIGSVYCTCPNHFKLFIIFPSVVTTTRSNFFRKYWFLSFAVLFLIHALFSFQLLRFWAHFLFFFYIIPAL